MLPPPFSWWGGRLEGWGGLWPPEIREKPKTQGQIWGHLRVGEESRLARNGAGPLQAILSEEEAPTYLPKRGELPQPSIRLLYSASDPTQAGPEKITCRGKNVRPARRRVSRGYGFEETMKDER